MKKLGIGQALEKANPGLFPGGEEEILDRMQVTFETVANADGSTTVVTKFTVTKIPTTAVTGTGKSATDISNALQ